MLPVQSLAQSAYTPYTFSTLAGLAGSKGSVDGMGNVARFSHPVSVAVDSAASVYVADYFNSTIRKVTAFGVVTTFAGQAGSWGQADGTGNSAQFAGPSGVAVDSEGNVYVADRLNNTMRKVSPSGSVTTLAGSADALSGSADGPGSAARFHWPWGVAVDGAGNVIVADSANETIRKVTPTSVVTTLAGLAGSSGGADGKGSAARFGWPTALAVDSGGNVYVADSGNNTIRKVTTGGVVTTLAGQAGTWGRADGTGSTARFGLIARVAVDGAGTVYVADYFNSTIRKVTPTGVVTTLAGLARIFGGADGTGSAARFNYPSGVAVDAVGTVYVGDAANYTIRKGFPEQVTTRSTVISGPGFGFNGGQFGFTLTGPTGRLVIVEASTDLVSWLPIWTNTFAGALNFTDPQSSVYSNRFYRTHTP